MRYLCSMQVLLLLLVELHKTGMLFENRGPVQPSLPAAMDRTH